MTTKRLSDKQQAFLENMQQNPEQERWGFELLAARSDARDYLDHLFQLGFFAPSKNPTRIEIEGGKYVRVPYWAALDYLKACAQNCTDDPADLAVGAQIIRIVKDISTAARQGKSSLNFHTFAAFAEILGLLPLQLVTDDIVELIPTWLAAEFDRGLVASELDKGLLQRLRDSELRADWLRAVRILFHCTAFHSPSNAEQIARAERITSVVEDFWLKEILAHHVLKLAERAPSETATMLTLRAGEIYSALEPLTSSWVERPAIEQHAQNHEWGAIESHIVDYARDSLICWLDSQPGRALVYVDQLLASHTEILQRLAIYCVSVRWTVLRRLDDALLGLQLFSDGLLHESFQFLNAHFGDLPDAKQDLLLRQLREYGASVSDEIGAESVRYLQRRWLIAMRGKGNAAADAWFAELSADSALGPLPAHPDFHSYSEDFSGPGPSPYLLEELVEFARRDTIVERINAFIQQDTWRGPSIRALSQAVEDAVISAPAAFLRVLPEFESAKGPYKYGVLNGFKRLWDSKPPANGEFSWIQGWPALFRFFEFCVNDPTSWEAQDEPGHLIPSARWLPQLVASFIHAATRTDEHAFPPDHNERAWVILLDLLRKGEEAAEPRQDALTQAINTERGKALDAFFSLALRMCRLADQGAGGHQHVAVRITEVFEDEIVRCKNGNFEFSALIGAYFVNLEYIDPVWTQLKTSAIFDPAFQTNFSAALDGLAYAPARRNTYVWLRDSGAVLAGLHALNLSKHARDRLVERIALAFLWGEEQLSGPLFTLMFEQAYVDQLRVVASFYARAKIEQLSEGQIVLILAFLEKTIDWASNKPEAKPLLSSLAPLIKFVQRVEAREETWLRTLASSLSDAHHHGDFIQELIRLVPENSRAVAAAFEGFLDGTVPSYDHRGQMEILIRALAKDGLKGEALSLADRLRELPQMRLLFAELAQ